MANFTLPKAIGKNQDDEEVFVTDEMIDNLLSPENFGQAQKAAEKKTKQLSKEEWHLLRVRAKRDLFFLCTGVLGNTRLSVNLHGHLCTHIKRTENDRFHSYLLPRGNFKSTIITIGHSIQIVLPYTEEDSQYDDDPSPLPWPQSLGTDGRLLICHETHESAARFLYAITNHVTNNAVLMALFPEIVPTPRRHRINKWELELPRSITGNPEPTIDTLGVGGKSQGRHYNYIKLDDIYGDKARDSEAESETTIQWFDNIQSFFSLFSKDRLDLIGTRYSFDDVYAHAFETYGSQLTTYSRKIEETNPKTGKLEITFPEEFTPQSLEIIKKNAKVYNAQYLNDPSDNKAGFDPDWKRFFYWISPLTLAVFSGEKRERSIVELRDLDICILIDPGVSKSGGFVVTGMDYMRRIFILSALGLEMAPPDLVDLTFKSVTKWQPRTVAIESDIFAATFEPWMMTEMRVRSQFFHITPVHTAKRSKDMRIEGLTNYYANSQIYMNENQTELLEEYRVWGKSKNIHILDALAYGPEVWRPGFAPGTRAITESSSNQEDERDVSTGYSAIN